MKQKIKNNMDVISSLFCIIGVPVTLEIIFPGNGGGFGAIFSLVALVFLFAYAIDKE